MNRTKLVAVMVFALFVCVSAIAQADSFSHIMGVTVTPSNPGAGGSPEFLVNNSAMVDIGNGNGDDIQERGGPAIATDAFRVHYKDQTPATWTFDLGSVQAVDNMGFWNYLEFDHIFGDSQGLQDFTLSYSTDNVTYTSLGYQKATRNDGESNQYPGGATDIHDHFAIGANARYVQIGIPAWDADLDFPENNYGSVFGAGAGEVRFYAPAVLPGDVNFDGVVNIFDINLVSSHWGESGPTGDANSDMTVNIFDINLISANWSPSGGAAVPEPSTLVLAALGALASASAVAWKRKFAESKVDLS